MERDQRHTEESALKRAMSNLDAFHEMTLFRKTDLTLQGKCESLMNSLGLTI